MGAEQGTTSFRDWQWRCDNRLRLDNVGTKTQHLSVHPSLSSYDLRHPLQYEATYKAIVLVQESDLHIQENTSCRVRPSHIGLRAQEIAIR
jgi:hypothetical protein